VSLPRGVELEMRVKSGTLVCVLAESKTDDDDEDEIINQSAALAEARCGCAWAD
jgi:hypothetical protein